MILYSVYIDDWECPTLVFHTYEKQKADKFAAEYNEVNCTNSDDHNQCFVIQEDIDPKVIESRADTKIANYTKHYLIYHIMKHGNLLHTNWKCKFCAEQEEYACNTIDYIEIFINSTVDPQFIDFDSDEYQAKINSLLREWNVKE